jgi:large subunit ribosomal protein L19e
MRIETAKRIAADEYKSGISRIWIDMDSLDQIQEAATRDDVRGLMEKHIIQAKPKKGNSNARFKKRLKQLAKERRRGPGSVRGTRNARFPRKRRWIKTIRALRDELKTLKNENKIDSKTYRKYYRIAKGGTIKSRAQLRSQIKLAGLMGE